MSVCPPVYTGSVSPVLPSTNPHLEVPPIVEVGSRWPVNCTLDGLFPASDANVYLDALATRLAGQRLSLEHECVASAWLWPFVAWRLGSEWEWP